MDTHTSHPRPLRNVTAAAVATGSALAVALLPLVLGALAARSVGGDPMASVNALIAGGGERARLCRDQLPVLRGIRRTSRGTGGRSALRRLLAGGEDVRGEVRHGRER
ncbi:hypothetical protein WBG99_32445 [Streptomyces sp. TG1A-60]|uniref:hypothetical protein n=1 Tax=Streptomyces sp. TG1A-60 TaxID=3129111 RepID=UPI0030CEF38A